MVLEALTNIFGILCLMLGTILLLIVYHRVIRYWDYFSKNNVKCVRGLPFVGSHYKSFLGNRSLAQSFVDIYNQFPNERLVGVYELFGKPSYVIRDPELLKNIAVRDFNHFSNRSLMVNEDSDPLLSRSLVITKDQKWKDMRTTLTPAFSGAKIRAMASLLVHVSNVFCIELKKELGDQTTTYDMKELFGRISSDAIATCAFGMDVNSMKDRDNEFFKTGSRLTDFRLKFVLYEVVPQIMNFFRVRIFDKDSTDYFRKVIEKNMKYRKIHKIDRPDMIQILLEIKKEMAESSCGDGSVRHWEDDDLIAQSITFFLAGYSTISSTMAFLTHELAINPTIQEKLYEEITETLEKLNGVPVDYAVLHKMKYLDMVMSEVLRRWVGFVNGRAVNKPYVLENHDGTKVQLNIGDLLWMPAGALHLDPKYHQNPTKFDPERFSNENKNNMQAGTFFPFGMGPRSCIASRFALIECKSFIFHIVSEFRLEKCAKTMDPIILHQALPEPRDGFWLQLRNRKQQ